MIIAHIKNETALIQIATPGEAISNNTPETAGPIRNAPEVSRLLNELNFFQISSGISFVM